jgi:glycine/D-amino acid oxidase-like deaminating enzyme/nitrite reductase/ring-hydroxylating ferredoxin subunit
LIDPLKSLAMELNMGSDRSGETRSLWMETAEARTFPTLAADASADVCVVGGGIAGVMAAYVLAKAGRSVILLDAGVIGGGETGRTTAHLASAQDDRFVALERMHGTEGARLAAESHAAAVDLFERVCAEEGIECDFTRLDGYLFAQTGGDAERLRPEQEAAARAAQPVEWVDHPPFDPFGTGPCLRFPRQGRFHPLKFLHGVTGAVTRLGGVIHEHARVESVEGGDTTVVRTTTGLSVRADATIVATNSPISDRVRLHTRQAPYRTYVVAARVPRGSVPDALYWDDGDPYLYVRRQPAGDDVHDYVIVGGEDHKTGQKDDGELRLERLEAWTRERFPATIDVPFRWSGQVFEPNDGLAFTGAHPGSGMRNVWLHTGDSGQGMTHGGIAGMLLGDLVHGRENRWSEIYDPGRTTLRAAKEFARENLNVALQYSAYVLPGEVGEVDEIARGEGRIVRRGHRLLAVYRDDEDRVHARSAICTHMGCVVDWNGLERTWDCPCHGSRFATDGSVITGPAVSPLGEAEIEEEAGTGAGRGSRSGQ